MNKVKIAYWVSTVLLALLLIGSSVGDLTLSEQIVAGMNRASIPLYLVPFFGVMKLLGLVTILLPQLARLREGAYAGLLFYAIGAVYVHIASGDAIAAAGGAIAMLVLVLVSYYTSLKVRGLYGVSFKHKGH